MLTGNQWWLFKLSEKLNILWLEETTDNDEGAPCLCSSHYIKNVYKLFHDQQENFTGISGKGEKSEVCISLKRDKVIKRQ